MTNPCCCHNKVLLSRFNITGLGVMLFGHTHTHTSAHAHTHEHTHTHTRAQTSSFYTCFLVSFPFHLIPLFFLLFNASASVVYSISAPCCSVPHLLPTARLISFIISSPLPPPFSVFLIFPDFLFVFHFLSSFFSTCFLIPIDFILFFILFLPCFFLTLVSVPPLLLLHFSFPPPRVLSYKFPSRPAHPYFLISHLPYPPPSLPFSSLLQSYNWGDDGP